MVPIWEPRFLYSSHSGVACHPSADAKHRLFLRSCHYLCCSRRSRRGTGGQRSAAARFNAAALCRGSANPAAVLESHSCANGRRPPAFVMLRRQSFEEFPRTENDKETPSSAARIWPVEVQKIRLESSGDTGHGRPENAMCAKWPTMPRGPCVTSTTTYPSKTSASAVPTINRTTHRKYLNAFRMGLSYCFPGFTASGCTGGEYILARCICSGLM